MPVLDAPYFHEHLQWRRDCMGIPELDWPSGLFVDAMAGDFQIGGNDETGREAAIWYGGFSRGNTHAGMAP